MKRKSKGRRIKGDELINVELGIYAEEVEIAREKRLEKGLEKGTKLFSLFDSKYFKNK